MLLELDEYNCVITTHKNIKEITKEILKNKSIIFTWENDSDCYTVILNYPLNKPMFNSLTRGLKPNNLFISIIGIGCFGFRIGEDDIYKTYYQEKLHMNVPKELIELFNGIRKELYKLI